MSLNMKARGVSSAGVCAKKSSFRVTSEQLRQC